MTGIRDITVKAGEDFTIRIPYSGGQPKPIADFINGDREVFPDGERVTIEVLEEQIDCLKSKVYMYTVKKLRLCMIVPILFPLLLWLPFVG